MNNDSRVFKACAVLLFGLAALAAREVAPEKISLQKAIEVALQQNRQLQKLELSLGSRSLSVAQARTEFMISLRPDGTASAEKDSNTLGYGLTASKKTTLGTTVEAGGRVVRTDLQDTDDVHRDNVRVAIRQPLLRHFGFLVNKEPLVQAAHDVDATRREVELEQTDLIVQVVETYEELFRLQKQVEFDEQALKRLDKLVKLTRVRERQGRTTRVDLFRLELQYGEAQVRLGQGRQGIKSLQADFADLLGYSVGKEFVAETTPILAVDEAGLKTAADTALSNRLDYAQVLQDCRDTERGIHIARRNLLPDLNLISSYERFGTGVTSSEAGHLDKDTWFVGLTLESDLNRSREKLGVAQAELTAENARQTLVILESGIRRQVQQSIVAYEQARDEITLAERNYELARNRAVLARRLFEMGKGDNFSVSDAEDALQQAQHQMLTSQAATSVAAYRLLRTLGVLIEYPDDLKPKL